MRPMITASSVLLAAVLLGGLGACSTGPQLECAKAKQCGTLGGKTEDQCNADGSSCFDKLQKSAVQACRVLAERWDDYRHCTAGLTCADRQNPLTINAACKTQWDAVVSAAAATNFACPCYY